MRSMCSVEGCGSLVQAKGLCRKHYSNERTKRLRAEVRGVVRVCVGCGSEFSGRRPNAIWCSSSCKDKHRVADPQSRAKPRLFDGCKMCGASLDGKLRHAEFCSDDCKARHHREVAKSARPDRPCVVCTGPIAGHEQGHRIFCSAECRLLQARAWRYGIAGATLRQMIAAADGHCSLCGNPFNGDNHIDHCHASGSVRGLLCSPCNTGLGQFRDNADLLRRAADYVERVRS